MLANRLVAVSDFCTHVPPLPLVRPVEGWAAAAPAVMPRTCRVTGGYLERLPLAAVAAGLAVQAEVWSFAGRDGESDAARGEWQGRQDPPGLIRRVFRADPHAAPYGSAEVRAHLATTGAPDLLCLWGLGVTRDLLEACGEAIVIYNSIDHDPLRIPGDVAARVDLFLTGADWQSDVIRDRVPGARTLVLPIGPDFASGETFRPLGVPKDRDVVYVACAQDYKRHHVLFDAMAARPGTRGLLVIGYGHLADAFRAEADARGLDLEIIGPPGLSHDGVNAQINRARVGVVCGQRDGAPAILTEYALAGLPVLAADDLSCGLQYVTPETGLIAAPGADFAAALDHLIEHSTDYDPRPVALARWGWPHSIARLGSAIAAIRADRERKRAS